MFSFTILTPARHDGRSAVGHLLQVFGVPGPLHRDLGEGAVNVAQIVGRQFDASRSDVLLQPVQSTTLPFGASWMAICVIAVVGVAPCQCFSPGGNQTTSPGRISSTGPPQACTHPRPDVTINV
jgi:hypothetical protein